MSGPIGSSQWMYATGAAAPQQSLKFNDDESQYLSWTPAAAGNRKTWTWSGWVKRGKVGSGTQNYLFGATTDNYNVNWTIGGFFGDQFTFYSYTSSQNYQIQTNRVFRDPSNWYHVVIAFDTTAATSSDRIKLYINGVQETSLATAAYPTQNLDDYINNTIQQDIGRSATSSFGMDGYLSDINFIDGQALDPTDFGQFTDGYWEKKDYAGSYGTNGFHLTFADDVVSEGFNAVTYRGTGTSQSVSGLGLAADLVWVKNRSNVEGHNLFDSVRGSSGNYKTLQTNTTGAEITPGVTMLSTLDSDGFTLGTNGGVNQSGDSFVAWAWDAGSGSAASNTDGSITSTVKANPSYGFSIVSWTGNGTSGATIGHSLGVTPDAVIVKNRTTSGTNWPVFHSSQGTGSNGYLDITNSWASGSTWGSTQTFNSTVFSVGSQNYVNNSGDNMIAYCFAEVAGYSSIGSFTGTGAAGNAITTGFEPAFVMIKATSISGEAWWMFDNTRSTTDPRTKHLRANTSGAEITDASAALDFTSTGFEHQSSQDGLNKSGTTYIYMAFADTREAAFWKDVSGQGNHWTPSGLDYRDSLIDSPANNFAVMNALEPSVGTSVTLSEGNLKTVGSTSSYSGGVTSSFEQTSGKWYWEVYVNSEVSAGSNHYSFIGAATGENNLVHKSNNSQVPSLASGVNGWSWEGDGTINLIGTGTKAVSSVTAPSAGDVLGFAIDLDNGNVYFYYNGTAQNSGSPVITGVSDLLHNPMVGVYNGSTVTFQLRSRQHIQWRTSGWRQRR
jgi:hypothetical protein